MKRLQSPGLRLEGASGYSMGRSSSCWAPMDQTEVGLKAEFTVRADTNQVEMIIIRLPVNQNQIRFDVAVAMIRPLTGKRMIKVAMG